MVEYRNAPTQERSRNTLNAIMESADRLFAEVGVDAATNKDIAKGAGVSIGSLYRFFPNKLVLVQEYVQRYLAEMAAQMTAPLPTTPDIDNIGTIVETLIDRSAETRRKFCGYSSVRTWKDPATGERPSLVVREAEFELLNSLFENSIYDFDEDEVRHMTTVLVLSVYPMLEIVTEASKREGAALLAEAKHLIRSYATDLFANAPTKAN